MVEIIQLDEQTNYFNQPEIKSVEQDYKIDGSLQLTNKFLSITTVPLFLCVGLIFNFSLLVIIMRSSLSSFKSFLFSNICFICILLTASNSFQLSSLILGNWAFSIPWCILTTIINESSHTIICFSIMVMSIKKYLIHKCKLFTNHENDIKNNAKTLKTLILIVLWISGLTLTVPTVISTSIYEDDCGTKICSIKKENKLSTIYAQIAQLFVGFFIPTIISVICYTKIKIENFYIPTVSLNATAPLWTDLCNNKPNLSQNMFKFHVSEPTQYQSPSVNIKMNHKSVSKLNLPLVSLAIYFIIRCPFQIIKIIRLYQGHEVISDELYDIFEIFNMMYPFCSSLGGFFTSKSLRYEVLKTLNII